MVSEILKQNYKRKNWSCLLIWGLRRDIVIDWWQSLALAHIVRVQFPPEAILKKLYVCCAPTHHFWGGYLGRYFFFFFFFWMNDVQDSVLYISNTVPQNGEQFHPDPYNISQIKRNMSLNRRATHLELTELSMMFLRVKLPCSQYF